MRQFLLGNDTAPTGAVAESTAYGSVGFAYLDKTDNKMKFLEIGDDNSELLTKDGEFYAVLVRRQEEGGNVVLPLHTNHLSVAYGKYNAENSGHFHAEFTITDVDPFLDYTVIIVKKGKKFNERNKWTATVHSKHSDTPATIAQKLVDAINANKGAEVEASVSTATVSIDGLVKDMDFKIVLADELIDTEVENVTNVMAPYGDVKYIIDLANKAAADAGFEYTYQDDLKALYPKYPLDPLAGDPSEDPGYDIFTLRFAEPRDMKTRDEVVHQIVQIALPTDSSYAEDIFNLFRELIDVYRGSFLYAENAESVIND